MSDTHESEPATTEVPPPGKAYVIAGFRRDAGRLTPSIGVLIVPRASEGEMPKAPDRRMLDKMGFQKIESIEEVRLIGTPSAQPALYVFERTPAAKSVFIAQVAKDGSLSQAIQNPGQLHSMIPELSGSAVDRLITPRGAPSATDLRSTLPPIKAGHEQKKKQSNSRG